VLALLVVGPLASLGAASPALAGLKKEFSVFSQCPINAPGVTGCVYSTTTSGEFKIGNKTVPISKTVVLQGGVTEASPQLVSAANGETLSRTALPVPGGIIGIELLGPLTEVTATAELAGPVQVRVGNFGRREGSAVSLPLKVKLDNPLLGGACYIASDSEPLEPQLTTGTTSPPSPNTPISGSPGTLVIAGAGKIDIFRDSSLVDNAFSVPGANGCAGLLSLLVDPAVDLQVGIPAAGGKNTAVLNGTLEETSVNAVKAQAALPEIGRCQKVPAEKVNGILVYHGGYADAGCTYESAAHLGKYEWTPGAGAGKSFTGEGKTTTLETVGKSKVTCVASTASGEYTGPKTAQLRLALSGCKLVAGGEACQSAGSGAAEIATGPLQAELGFIKDAVSETGLVASVGWDLKGGPRVISAECGAAKEALAVTGSVIAPVSAFDKMLASYVLKAKATAGHQEPESFEEEPTDTLSATLAAGAAEQAGLTSAVKVLNGEKLEFKALSE
jgi:hypothetical protein